MEMEPERAAVTFSCTWTWSIASEHPNIPAMARKFSLPLADAAPKPTVDAMRKRLGGRASTEAGAGDPVVIAGEGGIERPGVVLFVRGEDLDVWTEDGFVRRTRRSQTRPLRTALSKDLASIAGDAKVFGGLHEGERVRYQEDSGLCEGILIEKCRFGALIERDDHSIVGVGFRRMWPAALAGGHDTN